MRPKQIDRLIELMTADRHARGWAGKPANGALARKTAALLNAAKRSSTPEEISTAYQYVSKHR
ncbi:hypothetical protein [Pseudonocardia spinosispora]|uniref:hypothetical protein n=1 Tax=Pseudonocardia spinosispora TaxID=103441 RepID=UPI00041E4D3C|nr:hypothetical protein [Pseudonocardia spinosispora]